MTTKFSLAAGAALGVLALAAAAPADAAGKKGSGGDPLAAQREAERTADMAAMKAQIQALSDRVAAGEQVQTQLRQQLQQAQQAAQASQQAAQSAQSAVQTAKAETAAAVQQIPTQVKTEVAAIKPKPGWTDSTTVTGRMYYNVSSITQKSNGMRVAPSGVGFDLKRFYLAVDHRFNDTYSGNLTTDVNYVGNDGETQIYIKKAYLQAKVSDALTVRLGSADLPWVPFAEEVYGYRFLEQTIIDRTKFGTSADWGVHALGKFADGKVSYAVAVINGAGYKAPLRSDSVDIEGRLSYSANGLTLGIGGYTGKLGKDVVGTSVRHTATRWDAIAAYQTKKFRVGAEYFSAQDWNQVLAIPKDSSNGWSVFGSVNLTDQISAFTRYDWVRPSDDLNPALKDQYFNLGLNWEPAKTVDFALVYKKDAVDNGFLSTGNGAIGGSNKGTYDEFGLFGQFRW
jgi:hypothetical protein